MECTVHQSLQQRYGHLQSNNKQAHNDGVTSKRHQMMSTEYRALECWESGRERKDRERTKGAMRTSTGTMRTRQTQPASACAAVRTQRARSSLNATTGFVNSKV